MCLWSSLFTQAMKKWMTQICFSTCLNIINYPNVEDRSGDMVIVNG